MADSSQPFVTPSIEAPSLPDWPMFGLDSDMRPFLARTRQDEKAVALVTLVAAEGGGPRRPGAQMAVTGDDLRGFLSGGCVEADIVRHARDCLQDGRARRLIYGDGSPYFDIRLLCGRSISVHIERVLPDDPAVGQLLDLTRERHCALWRSDGYLRTCTDAGGTTVNEIVQDGKGYGKLYRPATRLYIVGCDPSVIAIATLAQQSGFETILVRVDGPERPPPIANVAYCRRPLCGELDEYSAVVVAQHDGDADHSATLTALRSCASYVGLMGARRHVEPQITRLREAGVPPHRLAQLKAPVGLPLGSHAPWEIAVSVIGEIIQHFNA